MKDARDVVKALVRTEKGSMEHQPLNKYLFWVDTAANKIEIRRAVEEIYSVKVKDVNTFMVKGKMRRVRYKLGKSSDWKKAIVTLKEGSKIEVV